MILKLPALRIVLTNLLFLTALAASAQPTLPDITGTVNNGTVILSWNCQYNGVKAISVLRSADSGYNYANVGYVKKLDKGIQTFVDAHPMAGKNYYKLAIVFSSGLNWNSNFFGVYVDKSALESANANVTGLKSEQLTSNVAQPKQPVYITTQHDTAILTHVEAQPPRKAAIHFEDGDINQPLVIRSQYIFTDPTTGNINLNIPDDVKVHHFSLRFYDDEKHLLLEIPRINASSIIIDRRNFRKKGLVKFVLRKDVVELESGYITIY